MRDSGTALALAALLACAGEAPAVKTSSAPRPPAWIARAPSSEDALFFAGAKGGAASLEEGKSSAIEAARAQAAQYIGVAIRAEHRDVMSTEEAENLATDTVQSRATAMLRSAELVDVYYERISREAAGGTVDRFDVWALIRLPRAEVARERMRQAEEAQQAATAAVARFREGLALEAQGDSVAALARYREALASARDLPGRTPTSDAAIPTASALAARAQDAAAAARAKARRAIVIGPDWVAGAVMEALSRQGFAAQAQAHATESAALAEAKAQGMPWVIVVRATATPGGPVFSQVAATAALDVRALDARTGAVVALAQKQAKGVGRTAEAARLAAASEAGVGAGSEVASALVAREDAGF